MRFNFYTAILYFWVLWFVIFTLIFAFTLDWQFMLRAGIAVIMIVLFSVVDSYHEDRKILVGR